MRKLTTNCILIQATRLIICIPILLTTHVIVVTESSKFQNIGLVNLLPTHDVSCVVTDSAIPIQCEQYLLEQKIEVKKVS